MRLRGFLLGGLAGAAAALYVARKRPGTAALAAGVLASACSTIGHKAMSLWNNDWTKKAVNKGPKRTDDTAGKFGDGWVQIEAMMNSDPELKQQAEEIMAESSNKTH
ncbi:hypothetical protein [Paenibacillus sp. Leaf72]|uniref:hypothetical protein n=1 Tax=Paenibacillus sp. Leaf72 TaxID=1736234 RepID=UPI0006F5DC29|nr:hypothetical protein [Paenibacillus sp. Leaf72]KQO17432.1 hypothetical protein ASF12_01720 [Paenibacillus sp. Leaf72]